MNLLVYFVKSSFLLRIFDEVDIKHVPWFENQEANDLAQTAYGYRVSKERLEELVGVKENLISINPFPFVFIKFKLVGVDRLDE